MITVTAPRAAAGLLIGTARTAAELDAAAELLAQQLRWGDDVATATSDDEARRLCRPDPDVRLLLARRGGETVGVARVRGLSPGRGTAQAHRAAKLTHLYVPPEARGAGAEEALVAQAAVLAWWFGCRQLHVATATWSAPGRRALERAGLRPAGGDGLSLPLEPLLAATQG